MVEKDRDQYAMDIITALTERTIKRLWVTIILLIVLLVASNAAWIYYESQFEVVETTTQTVEQDSGTEFSDLIHGMRAADVWAVMDELMSVLQATRPRLYDGTMNQIRSA